MSKLVINDHWATKNVNLLFESAEQNPDEWVIDSKDAKTIILGESLKVYIFEFPVFLLTSLFSGIYCFE